jgi:hypothetical protein
MACPEWRLVEDERDATQGCSEVTRLFQLEKRQVGTSCLNIRLYSPSTRYLYLHGVILRPCLSSRLLLIASKWQHHI